MEMITASSVFTQKSIGESLMNPGHMRIKSDLKLDNKGYSDVNTLLFRVMNPLFLKYGNGSPELRGFPSWGGMFSKADLSENPTAGTNRQGPALAVLETDCGPALPLHHGHSACAPPRLMDSHF